MKSTLRVSTRLTAPAIRVLLCTVLFSILFSLPEPSIAQSNEILSLSGTDATLSVKGRSITFTKKNEKISWPFQPSEWGTPEQPLIEILNAHLKAGKTIQLPKDSKDFLTALRAEVERIERSSSAFEKALIESLISLNHDKDGDIHVLKVYKHEQLANRDEGMASSERSCQRKLDALRLELTGEDEVTTTSPARKNAR